ncbi:hypothetical protein JCM10212_006773 [Sporobolomyces blumeae]
MQRSAAPTTLLRAIARPKTRPASRASSTSALSHPRPSPRPGHSLPPKLYGQPLPSTHPHLLESGQLTPGISAREYEERRRRLVERLEDGSTVVIAGGKLKYMSQNIFYKFRQRSNLWYLTGWEEPDSVLVLQKTSDAKGYKMTMFVRPKDAYDESWNGPRSGQDGACQVFGADDACDIAWFSRRLEDLLNASTGPVYIDLPHVSAASLSQRRSRTSSAQASVSSPVKSLFDFFSLPAPNPKDDIDGVIKALRKKDVRSAAKEVERLRLIKSPAEIAVMKRAADISSKAHSDVMAFCARSLNDPRSLPVPLTEHSLVSNFEYTTSLRGSPRPAYVPVCAAGTNALTIHYVANNQPVRKGDLVMLDAGCEYGGYASDITRTFPASGKFTSAQSDLYAAVLSVHRTLLTLCATTSPSSLTLESLHRESVDLTKRELDRLGFERLRGGELERVLYPHFVSHPIGIDLHDTMGFGRDERLEPGMVITIEPGLYVPPQSNFPKAFHDLAVRIEDEVVLGETEGESSVLSANAPKEVVDVEATCSGRFSG